MRTITLSFMIVLFAMACTKNSVPVTPSVTTGGTITITAISPAMPYADDEITITGTGFNVDKAKDTVDFGGGDAATGHFVPYFYGQGTTSKAIVISATSTKLVIKAVNPDSAEVVTPTSTSHYGLNKALFSDVLGTTNSLNQIRVRVGGKQTSALTPFKQLPWAQITDLTGLSTITPLAPGDAFGVTMHGVNSDTLCGNRAKLYLSCGASAGCGFVGGYINPDFNGNTPQCNCDDFGTLVYGCANNVYVGKTLSHSSVDLVQCLVPPRFFLTDYSPQKAGNNTRVLIKLKMINNDGKVFVLAPVYCLAYPTHL